MRFLARARNCYGNTDWSNQILANAMPLGLGSNLILVDDHIYISAESRLYAQGSSDVLWSFRRDKRDGWFINASVGVRSNVSRDALNAATGMPLMDFFDTFLSP